MSYFHRQFATSAKWRPKPNWRAKARAKRIGDKGLGSTNSPNPHYGKQLRKPTNFRHLDKIKSRKVWYPTVKEKAKKEEAAAKDRQLAEEGPREGSYDYNEEDKQALMKKGQELAAADAELSALRKEAKAGDVQSQLLLGLMYLVGDGVVVDLVLARKWLTHAAEQGEKEAQFLLGAIFARGLHRLDQRPNERFYHNNPKAVSFVTPDLHVATLKATDFAGAPLEDLNDAMHWWRLAAEQSHCDALYRLAIVHFDAHHGHPHLVDHSKARELLEQIAALDTSLCHGTANTNQVTSISQSSEAETAVLVPPEALMLLSSMLIDGVGGAKDAARGRELIEHVAREFEAPVAFFTLGLIDYSGGISGAPDMAAARRWFSLAAERGHSDAQVALAEMLRCGHGGAVDVDAAVQWEQRAAGAREGKDPFVPDTEEGSPEEELDESEVHDDASEMLAHSARV